MYKTLIFSAAAVLVFSAAAQAQTADTVSSEAPPPPVSITQHYVPVKTARAPLALLVDDSPAVASAAETTSPSPPQPVAMEEVGNRPAIFALTPGRFAITVSSPQQR